MAGEGRDLNRAPVRPNFAERLNPARRPVVLGTLVILVAALTLFAACGGGSEDASGPRLALAGDSFDLGEVKAGGSVERMIDFRNEGTQPLEVTIADVRSATKLGCECWVDEFEVRPEVVEPGASGQLVFKLKSPEGMQEMEDTLLADLKVNDPEEPLVTISLRFRMTP